MVAFASDKLCGKKVLSLTNYSADNEAIIHWPAGHRRERTDGIIRRLHRGAESGDLPEHTDTQALGDYVATLLHGISVRARDGVSRDRLLVMTEIAMHTFDLMTASPATH